MALPPIPSFDAKFNEFVSLQKKTNLNLREALTYISFIKDLYDFYEDLVKDVASYVEKLKHIDVYEGVVFQEKLRQEVFSNGVIMIKEEPINQQRLDQIVAYFGEHNELSREAFSEFFFGRNSKRLIENLHSNALKLMYISEEFMNPEKLSLKLVKYEEDVLTKEHTIIVEDGLYWNIKPVDGTRIGFICVRLREIKKGLRAGHSLPYQVEEISDLYQRKDSWPKAMRTYLETFYEELAV